MALYPLSTTYLVYLLTLYETSSALAGLGSSRMINIPIEPLTARLSIPHLRAALEDRLQRKQAVYAVVVVVGSTEEGAVDPVEEVLEVRREFAARGMRYVHVPRCLR